MRNFGHASGDTGVKGPPRRRGALGLEHLPIGIRRQSIENGLVAAGGELLEFEERSSTLAGCCEQADTAVRAPLLTA
jgi:hypothetical protein